MKPTQSRILALAMLVVFQCQHVIAQLPAGTKFLLTPSSTNSIQLTLSDPENHSYKIQSSADLKSWQDMATWRLFNGNFNRQLVINPSASPTLYYRAVYNPSLVEIRGSVADATILPATVANYANQVLSTSFLIQPVIGQNNTPANNATTNAGATLGRVLFYDKRLSFNQTVSCSSCHQAEHGFSDPRKFSVGFNGELTSRNSMGLTNSRWYLRRSFFWDERSATLEDQVLQPIQNSGEMGMTLPALVTRLSAEPFYATLFTSAFGSSTVNSQRISFALAQFIRSIVSTHSKFDTGLTTNFSNFTASENLGRQIFNGRGNCTACHGSDNFVPGNAINNNGLENPYIDKGVGAISGRPQDEGLFKVGTLRNIELTAPYMHDGRFATLEQVVEFYNSGVVNHPNLSPPLRNPPGSPNAGQPTRLNLTAAEKTGLVAFLKTLTEKAVTTDEKFSDPFNYGD